MKKFIENLNFIGAVVFAVSCIITAVCFFSLLSGIKEHEKAVILANFGICSILFGFVFAFLCLILQDFLSGYSERKQTEKDDRLRKSISRAKTVGALVAVAASNPDGFTVDAHTLQPVESGYAVAVAETQNSFNAEGLAKVVNFVENNAQTNAFGGWLDKETGLFYWDAVIVFQDKRYAIEAAKRNGQIALFDLNTCTEIRL